MSALHSAVLTDRAVIAVTGKDAITLLQGLVTVDLDRFDKEALLFGALLAPQGKIQFDFFLHSQADGLLIDMDATRAEAFLKRMMLYKLRADVTLEDVSAEKAVKVAWSADGANGNLPSDPRLTGLGGRAIVNKDAQANGDDTAYHAHRVSLGVPEAGKDFAFDDIFPHDAMMDANSGVNFDKGCYVGQEVVSRVQHRSTARKRFYLASGPCLTEGAEIVTGEKTIGTIGRPYGDHAVALVRVDKINEDDAVTVNGQAITLTPPAYFQPTPA